jgi:hypothetical protein
MNEILNEIAIPEVIFAEEAKGKNLVTRKLYITNRRRDIKIAKAFLLQMPFFKIVQIFRNC